MRQTRPHGRSRVVVVGAGVVGPQLRRCGCSRPATGSTCSRATCRWRRRRASRPRSGTPTSPSRRTRSPPGARTSYAELRAAGGRRGHRGAMMRRAPRCCASRTADPWWVGAVPDLDARAPAGAVRRRAGRSWRRSSTCRVYLRWLRARVDEARRHGDPDGLGALPQLPEAAARRQLLRARLAPARRRPDDDAGARPGGAWSSRSASTVVARPSTARRTSCRAAATSWSAAPRSAGEWSRHPVPGDGRRHPAPRHRAGARRWPARASAAQGRAAPGAARGPPGARRRRSIHCYGHGGAGVTLSLGLRGRGRRARRAPESWPSVVVRNLAAGGRGRVGGCAP